MALDRVKSISALSTYLDGKGLIVTVFDVVKSVLLFSFSSAILNFIIMRTKNLYGINNKNGKSIIPGTISLFETHGNLADIAIHE